MKRETIQKQKLNVGEVKMLPREREKKNKVADETCRRRKIYAAVSYTKLRNKPSLDDSKHWKGKVFSGQDSVSKSVAVLVGGGGLLSILMTIRCMLLWRSIVSDSGSCRS